MQAGDDDAEFDEARGFHPDFSGEDEEKVDEYPENDYDEHKVHPEDDMEWDHDDESDDESDREEGQVIAVSSTPLIFVDLDSLIPALRTSIIL